MSLQATQIYEFGPFRLDPAERVLRLNDRPVSLTPKMFDILLFLVQRNGQIVEKEELMRAVWPDTFVEEANLTVNISGLRKALSEAPEGRNYIETIQRRGYRFETPLKQSGEATKQSAAAINPESALIPEESAPSSVLPAAAISERRQSLRWLWLPIVLVIVGGLAFEIYQLSRSRRAQSPAPFQTMKFTRLTTSGKAQEAVISPDGKYVLYIIADAGKPSLWIRQVAGESNIQIIPPTENLFGGLTFSRDGNFIYFLRMEADKLGTALYQMPVLGGEAKRLMNNLSTPVAVSPDGKSLAFLRHRPAVGETALVIAKADGSDERILTTRRLPESFQRTPAWSPDGKLIACQFQTNNRSDYGVAAISLEAGTEKIITTQRWEAGQISWLADGSGLVISAIKHDPDLLSTNEQLWQISYPGGETRRITNDLNRYYGVSLTAETKMLVTLQRDRQSNFWLVPQGQSELARQITAGSGRYDGLTALEWTPDGHLIYSTEIKGKRNLWLMGADGTNPRSLTPETKDRGYQDVSVSPDGRFIIYALIQDRPHLWRMSMAGGDSRQLTFGDGEVRPQISPDGEWIVYIALVDHKPVLMKMPVGGGPPIQLAGASSSHPTISPDGKLIAYQYWNQQLGSPPRIQIIPFPGGAPLKSFTFESQPIIRWAQDGKGLIYIDTRGGISNLWQQPLDNSKPTQLTDFKTDRIYNYAWSRDGKQLACVRGTDVSDVVLISDFR